MADPAPSQPGPRSTAIKAVVWSCEPAEKIVLSGKNKPTIKALKNANHNQPTDRLVGISLREAGSPSVTLPIAISNTGKSIVIVQVIGTVVPIISLGKTIHAAKTNVPTQPPYIANLYQPVGTVCCVSPITPRVARSCYPCVLHVSATTGGITFSLIPNTLSIGEYTSSIINCYSHCEFNEAKTISNT